MTADQPTPDDTQLVDVLAAITASIRPAFGDGLVPATADELDRLLSRGMVGVVASAAIAHLLAEQGDQAGPLLDTLSQQQLYRVLDASAVLMGLVVDRTPEAAAANRDHPPTDPHDTPSLDSLNAGTMLRAAYARQWGRLDGLFEHSTEQQLDEVRRAATDLLSALSAHTLRGTAS